MTSQHTAHVVQPGLGGRVGEGFERGDAQAVDGADVDDARGRERGLRGLEQRGYGLGELEDAFEVEGQDAVPGGIRVSVVGFAPVGAGVVDEDVEFCGCVLVVIIWGGWRFAHFQRASSAPRLSSSHPPPCTDRLRCSPLCPCRVH